MYFISLYFQHFYILTSSISKYLLVKGKLLLSFKSTRQLSTCLLNMAQIYRDLRKTDFLPEISKIAEGLCAICNLIVFQKE